MSARRVCMTTGRTRSSAIQRKVRWVVERFVAAIRTPRTRAAEDKDRAEDGAEDFTVGKAGDRANRCSVERVHQDIGNKGLGHCGGMEAILAKHWPRRVLRAGRIDESGAVELEWHFIENPVG